MMVPVALVFIVAGLYTSAMVRRPEWRPANLDTYHHVLELYGSVFSELGNTTSTCMRTVLSEFETQRCSRMWGKLRTMVMTASIPWAAGGVFLLISYELMLAVYRITRKKIAKKEIHAIGKVLDRPKIKPDRWAWYLCMRIIRVEIKKQKFNVMIPLDMNVPKPGTEVAVYQIKTLGRTIYTAAPHTPHVAIVAGERVS
jgi:hypothetical protein